LTRRQKAVRIQEILNGFYPNPQIPLLHRDPFTLLVAVLLSAQTTDRAVNLVTPALFELADNPVDMANQNSEAVLAIIRPLGLAPSKSRHVVAMSQRLVDHFNARVPADLVQLESLPGVGHKTASVVMCQAFESPAFPVDTHIHRLSLRWGLSNGKSVVQTEADLKKVFPRSSWIKMHLQMIYFGREYCPARSHDPLACPICQWAHQPPRNSSNQRP
jgi:endonuclease-3